MLAGWAALVPLAHLPTIVVGVAPPAAMLVLLALATAVAFAAPVVLARTDWLERAAAGLGRAAGALVWSAVLAYVVMSVAVAARGIAGFGDFDQLGVFHQSVWTTLHGHLFANTTHTRDGSMCSHLGVHFSPTLLLLVPPYAVWPTPLTLQAANAVAMGLIPLPLFALLRRRVGRGPAALLAIAALLVPSFLVAGADDMRFAGFLPVLFFTACWALEQRRWLALTLATVAALGVREDMGLVVTMLGLYAAARGRGLRVAAGLVVLGLAWFVVVTGAVMPRLGSPSLMWGPGDFMGSLFGRWGHGVLQGMAGMIAHPGDVAHLLARAENARYLYSLLLPLLGLPPLADWALLPALPLLGVNMLSDWPWMRSPWFQYSIVPLTFCTLATLQVAARLASRAPEHRREATALAAAVIVLCGLAPSLGMLQHETREPPLPRGPAEEVVRIVPPRASLYLAPAAFYPRLGGREKVGLGVSIGGRMLDPGFRTGYEYVVVWADERAPQAPDDSALTVAMREDPRFTLVRRVEPFAVYRRLPPAAPAPRQ